MPLFFYGTLMDPDVLDLVLGHSSGLREQSPGRLLGYRRVYVRGEIYPTLIEAGPEDTVIGTIYWPRSADDIAKLNTFEGSDYFATQLDVMNPVGDHIVAWVYRSGADIRPTQEDWALSEWRELHKARFLAEYPGWYR
ncbi:MAG: gamma-glutamylcyclotransferase family protein [Pseudomonadota bacterium]